MPSSFLEEHRIVWVRASVADVRAAPAHAAEQVTQALQGEVGHPLQHEDGWVQVRLQDGYIGWVRDWHLVAVAETDVVAFERRCTGRVLAPWTRVFAEPSPQAQPLTETLLGTKLVVSGDAHEDLVPVELPTGWRGWLHRDQIVRSCRDWEPVATSVCAMLQSFLGVPYVWGGRSPKGFDCSGLVQFVYGLHGVRLPRDSPQQFDAAEALRQPPRAGDLLFFGDPVSHVAVQWDDDRFLHARGHVRFNALDPSHPLHDAALARQYRGAGRVLPQNPVTDSVT